jgi:hypothetical protein
MCRIKSHRHPEGLRCNGLHRSAPRRALSTAQLNLAAKLQAYAVARSSAFGAEPDAQVEPDAPLTLSQKVLKALLAAAFVVQRQFAKVQEHRARVSLQRQEAAQARIQAEADERRAEQLQAASDAVETAHDALSASTAEMFRAQLLEQDVTPTPGWPTPENAMRQQVAYASVEADDLAQAILNLGDKAPLTPRRAQELRGLESKHTLTVRHRDRLANELRALPTHAEAMEAVAQAERGVSQAEAGVEQAEDHYDSI